MRTQLQRSRPDARGSLPLSLRARQGVRGRGQFAASFEHYEQGNRLRRGGVAYDADWNSEQVQRAKALFTPEFFARARGAGAPAPDPIFIVGLPRSGSTLLEQILSSHPLVEGTMELPDLVGIVRELGGGRPRARTSDYPQSLAGTGRALRCARWANATWRRRASIARATRRSSSTSCRTTSRTPA